MSGSTFVIASLGDHHEGEVGAAIRLIDGAVEAGVDAVKLDKRVPEACVSPAIREETCRTPRGATTYLQYRRQVEFGRSQFDEIVAHCRAVDVEWLAATWDVSSLAFVLSYEPRSLSIPSAMLTHRELLEAAAATGLPTSLGTGMSTLDEIDEAVRIFRAVRCPFSLVHEHAIAPAPSGELSLRVIKTLTERHGCPVGFAGAGGDLGSILAAVALGASSIERPVTSSGTRVGMDHVATVEPHDLAILIRCVRSLERELGDGVKRCWESERALRESQRWPWSGAPIAPTAGARGTPAWS